MEHKAIRILRFDQKYMIALDLAVMTRTCSDSKKSHCKKSKLKYQVHLQM